VADKENFCKYSLEPYAYIERYTEWKKEITNRRIIMFDKNLQSKYIQMIALIIIISISITACGGGEPEVSITDITWQWAEMVETEPASQSLVPDPENYTLFLASDGSLGINADCNVGGGTYTLDGSSLTIELGPMTMAYCGDQSLDQMYLGFLSNVESYAIENGQLVLELKDSAGTMTFNQE
jgi:heat shock protein HslJ